PARPHPRAVGHPPAAPRGGPSGPPPPPAPPPGPRPPLVPAVTAARRRLAIATRARLAFLVGHHRPVLVHAARLDAMVGAAAEDHRRRRDLHDERDVDGAAAPHRQ